MPVDAEDGARGEDVEEAARDLAHLCEALRVMCARGGAAGLELVDAEPVATLAALLAADLVRRVAERVGRACAGG